MEEVKLTREGEWSKALFQFNSAVTGLLTVYDVYGLDVYNKEMEMTKEIEKLAMQLHARLNGFDIPIGKEFEYISIDVPWGPDD
jgi:hypothetical protein